MIEPHKPTFPFKVHDEYYQEGITQRDWLAAMAMQGLLNDIHPDDIANNSNSCGKDFAKHIANASYEMADAIIERSKQ